MVCCGTPVTTRNSRWTVNRGDPDALTPSNPMTATQKDLAAAIAANRFGLGARPGDLETVSRDPPDWLTRQLKGNPPKLEGAGLKPSAATLARVLELRQEVMKERREQKKDGDDDGNQVAAA